LQTKTPQVENSCSQEKLDNSAVVPLFQAEVCQMDGDSRRFVGQKKNFPLTVWKSHGIISAIINKRLPQVLQCGVGFFGGMQQNHLVAGRTPRPQPPQDMGQETKQMRRGKNMQKVPKIPTAK
jgi:hypothetical protein